MTEATCSCGHANRVGARFCAGCGAPMSTACPGCGTEPEAGARFCDSCGTRLSGVATPASPPPPAPAAAEGERKQVTVLFADVARSMELAERFDPDAWTQIITGLFQVAVEAVQRYGGTVDKFTGDGLMALFGAPVAQEDHATRAAHAALALTAAARTYGATVRTEHGADLDVRVGLNSGEVVAGTVGDSGFTAVGHTVGLAQRMESIADPGTVRVSEHTARLLDGAFAVRDLGLVVVKGAADPMRVFALQGTLTRTRPRGGTARMVGRDAEWSTLLAALDAADSGQAQVIGIVGEAGAGKSRLVEELARQAEERGMLVRRTAGVSHGASVPLLPIRSLFGAYFGVTESDSAVEVREKVSRRVLDLDPRLDCELPVIFDFLEVPDPDRPAPQLGPEARRRRVLDLVRALTRSRSERTALVFVMEDLHWFDPYSVSFLDEWLPSFPGTRTLILTNFRPEFRAPWSSRSYYRQVPLPALAAPAVVELLGDLLGADPSVQALTADLTERASGNPFFLEEIVRGWTEDGTLEGQAGAYVLARPVEAVRLPSSVQNVLAGRIDRLDSRSKAVLQAAAVIGRTFSLPVLAAVVGTADDELGRALHELCAAELLQEGAEQEYRFWHPLTQEVAYASLLSAARRRHHRATARALLATGSGRHDELSALVASHFESAEDHLEAAHWQIRAARRAGLTDVQDALRRLQAAVVHVEAVPATPETDALGVQARALLIRIGARSGMDVDEAEGHVTAARVTADRIGDPAVLANLAMSTGVFRHLTGNHLGGLTSFQEAGRYADLTDDRDLQAWAHGSGCAAYPCVGPIPDGLAQVTYARSFMAADSTVGQIHAGYRVSDTLLFLGADIELAAGEVDAARADLLAAREAFQVHRMGDWEVWTLSLLAHLAEVSGLETDTQTAREALEPAHRVADEIGSALAKVKAHHASAIINLLDDRPAEAEYALTRGLQLARSQGAGGVDEIGMLGHLAWALHAQGTTDRALVTAQEAIDLAARTGASVLEARSHLQRARILRRTGRPDEARAALNRAEALAASTSATTCAAFVAEEQARLEGADLHPVAAAYEAIGAGGQALRIRAELGEAAILA